MCLVGKPAPKFIAQTVINGEIIKNFSLDVFAGKNIILFFYPLDFTFVCPTEIWAFQDHLEEFEKRNAQVVGCSVDSAFTHLAWLNTPKAKGGIQGIDYPLIADLNKTVAQSYDVLIPEEGIAYRGLFLMDTKGIIRHQLVNDLPLGRSIHEILRLLDALNFYEQRGEVCPANWEPNKKSMKPTQEGLERYFAAKLVE